MTDRCWPAKKCEGDFKCRVHDGQHAAARWEGFANCPGCGFDIQTGDGTRGCAWGDCPYLPEELDVFCPYCRFNFFTMEGNPPCEDQLACDHAKEPLEHVENVKRWAAARGRRFV